MGDPARTGSTPALCRPKTSDLRLVVVRCYESAVTVFHILHRDEWLAAQGAREYRPSSLDTEGFIHFSTAPQLLASAARYYAGQSGLVVLAVREDALIAELRYEPVRDEAFPHLYGPLNLDAVEQAVDLPLAEDGSFLVPQEWRDQAADFRIPCNPARSG